MVSKNRTKTQLDAPATHHGASLTTLPFVAGCYYCASDDVNDIGLFMVESVDGEAFHISYRDYWSKVATRRPVPQAQVYQYLRRLGLRDPSRPIWIGEAAQLDAGAEHQ